MAGRLRLDGVHASRIAMTDQARAAREDLAFMKDLAEDRGPAPGHFGAAYVEGGRFGALSVDLSARAPRST